MILLSITFSAVECKIDVTPHVAEVIAFQVLR